MTLCKNLNDPIVPPVKFFLYKEVSMDISFHLNIKKRMPITADKAANSFVQTCYYTLSLSYTEKKLRDLINREDTKIAKQESRSIVETRLVKILHGQIGLVYKCNFESKKTTDQHPKTLTSHCSYSINLAN
jgi:hypothetical protein